MSLRVLVVADEPAGSRWADKLGSFDWTVEAIDAATVVEKALAFCPHVAVIDLSFHPAGAVEAGFALRMIPNPGSDVKRLHGLPLLFVGGDEHWHDQVRARVLPRPSSPSAT
jgi:hypothetical protein